MFDSPYIYVLAMSPVLLLILFWLIWRLARISHLKKKAEEICSILEACGLIKEIKEVSVDRTFLIDRSSSNFRKKHRNFAFRAYKVEFFGSAPQELANLLATKDQYDAIPEGMKLMNFHHYHGVGDAVTCLFYDGKKQYAVCFVCGHGQSRRNVAVRLGILVARDS